MDVISLVNNTTKIVKYLAILLMLVGLFSVVNAASIPNINPNIPKPQNPNIPSSTTGGLAALTGAAYQLCTEAVGLLGVAIVLMIVLAAVVYAAGQVMGAETRARATVWATAMLTGAIIGAVLYVVVPWLIAQIIGSAATYDASKPCEFTLPGGTS